MHHSRGFRALILFRFCSPAAATSNTNRQSLFIASAKTTSIRARIASNNGILNPSAASFSSTRTLPVAFHHKNSNSRNRYSTASASVSANLNPLTMNLHSADEQVHDTNDTNDASMYNSFISASVDISQAQVSNGGILSFIRSARDIDANQRRKFIHQVVLNQNQNQKPHEEDASDWDSNLHVNVCPVLLPPNQLSSNIKAWKPSPSGDKIAIFTTDSSSSSSVKGQEQEQVIEIWDQGGTRLSRKISILPSVHGDISFDAAWFGSIAWNKEETAIVYSAERTKPKTASFFEKKKKVVINEGNPSQSPTISIGATNTLGYGIGENWGEKYGSTCRLDIHVVHIETGKVGRVENVPGGIGIGSASESGSTTGGFTLGQASFSPDGQYVVYTSWDAGGGGHMPKRLGSIYCYQRHCKIHQSSIQNLMKKLASESVDDEISIGEKGDNTCSSKDDDFLCLTPKDTLARSPRFLTNGAVPKLVWLSNAKGFDTHGGVMGLSCLEWDNENGAKMDTRKEIVDIVDLPEDDEFPGLFLNQLPDEQFVSQDGRYLFATTQWRSVTRIIRISTIDGEVIPIAFNLNGNGGSETFASQMLLCMTSTGDAIVAQSEPNSPAVIGFLTAKSLLSPDIGDQGVPSTIISKLGPIAATSTVRLCENVGGDDNLSYQVIRVHPPHGDVKAPVEGILILPSESRNHPVPLIVVPHGGPHSCTPTSYIPSYAYLSQGGKYAILHVNFRGSSGFGQAPLESLAGKVGVQDVKDVVYLTEHVMAKFNNSIDYARIGVCGGSHGGFLAGHLIGQYPELFKVAAMRNPVTNIATMTTATDIPDWCYVESLGLNSYDWSKFRGPTREDLTVMWDASREC